MTFNKRKKFFVFIFAGICFLFALTACNANVDTEMQIDSEFQGTRTISCILSNEEIAVYFPNGIREAERIIKKDIPSDMTYTLKRKKQQTEVTFIISFSSFQDYQTKITRILKKSNPENAIDPAISYENYDSVFEKGIKLQENFSSSDLFGWLINSLKKQGITPPEKIESSFDFSNTIVLYDDIIYETTPEIKVDKSTTFYMDAIDIHTYVYKDGHFARDIEYSILPEQYEIIRSELDPYMETLVPEDGTIEFDETTLTWSISFEAENEQRLEEQTNQALDTDDTVFSIEAEPNSSDSAKQTVTVTQNHNVSAFCDYEKTDTPLSSIVYFDNHYSWMEGQKSKASFQHTEDNGFFVVTSAPSRANQTYEFLVIRPVSIELISISTAVSKYPFNEIEREISFIVSKENDHYIGDILESRLKPLASEVSFEKTTINDFYHYIVRFEADDFESLSKQLRQYLSFESASSSGGALNTGSFLKSAYFTEESLDFDLILGDIDSIGGIEYRITYPILHHVPNQDAVSASSKLQTAQFTSSTKQITISSAASGFSLIGLAVLLFACASIIMLFIIFKRHLNELNLFIGSLRKKSQPQESSGIRYTTISSASVPYRRIIELDSNEEQEMILLEDLSEEDSKQKKAAVDKDSEQEQAIIKKDSEQEQAVIKKDSEQEQAVIKKDSEQEQAVIKKDSEQEQAVIKKDSEQEQAVIKKDSEQEQAVIKKDSEQEQAVIENDLKQNKDMAEEDSE